MFLYLKNSLKIFTLFFITVTISEALFANTIGKVIMLLDLDGTEQNSSNGPITDSLRQAIYHKLPIIVSGYTIERYLQKSMMTKKNYQELKAATYKEITKWSKAIEDGKKNIAAQQHLKSVSKIMYTETDDFGNTKTIPITGAQYLQILQDNLTKNQNYLTEAKNKLQPDAWILQEKEMKLTADQWFIHKKSNVFLLIPKKYLLDQKAPISPEGIKKIGFDVSAKSGSVDITKEVDAFCANLPETKPDFDAKYPAVIKPPVKGTFKVNINDVTCFFMQLPAGIVSPEEQEEEKESEKKVGKPSKKGLVRLLPTSPIITWIIYLQGHGSSATILHQSQAEYEKKLAKFESSIKFYEGALQVVKKTKKPYLYTETINNKIENIIADKKMLEKKLTQAQQRKLEFQLSHTHVMSEYTYISGLDFSDFQNLIQFFNTTINVAFLYYLACFAGGYNAAFVNQILTNISANFMVAVGSLTDKEVSSSDWRSWHLQSAMNEPLKFGFPKGDIKKYFDELEKYFAFGLLTKEADIKAAVAKKAQKQASLETALRSVTSTNKPAGWMNDAPFVRFPHGESFSAVDLDEKIYRLTSVQERIEQLEERELKEKKPEEKKPKKNPFNFSDKKGIYLSAQYVRTPITELGNAPIISVLQAPVKTVTKTKLYIPKKFIATHYFQKITSTLSFGQALARNFLQGLGIYTKRFLIEEFTSLDRPKIQNLIIEANRSETGTAIIKWVENNKGYSKKFNLREAIHIWPAGKSESERMVWAEDKFAYDVASIIQAMGSMSIPNSNTTEVTQKTVVDEFNTLKGALQKEIKFDEPDKKIALSKSFIEKLDTLVKQNPHTFDIALHEAVTKPLSPTYTKASRIALISQLLQRGANPMIPDKTGETAVQKAQKLNDPDILAVFTHFVSAVKSASKKEDPALVKLLLSLKLLQQKLTALAAKLKTVK